MFSGLLFSVQFKKDVVIVIWYKYVLFVTEEFVTEKLSLLGVGYLQVSSLSFSPMLHHAQTLKSFGKNKSMFVSSAISLLLILVCCVLTDFVDGFGTRAVILRRTGLRQPKTSSFTFCTRRSGKNNDDDDDNDNNNRSGGGFRESEFGQMTSGIARTGMKNLESYQVGDIVVAKYEIANLNIWVDCGYEIQELYLQGVNRETGALEKLDLHEQHQFAPAAKPERSRSQSRKHNA